MAAVLSRSSLILQSEGTRAEGANEGMRVRGEGGMRVRGWGVRAESERCTCTIIF